MRYLTYSQEIMINIPKKRLMILFCFWLINQIIMLKAEKLVELCEDMKSEEIKVDNNSFISLVITI